jgi:YidC/Oxa1 family membrane protein insertase
VGAIWDGIVNFFTTVLNFFSSIAGGNTAIGIIIFTIVVRFLILPLTLKAVRSSRTMQALQPYIKEINDKYKTKPGEKLSQEKSAAKQAEIMSLYRKFNVNPTASCLPILIQIPIFFAVYGAVQKSVGVNDPYMQFVQTGWNALSPDAAAAAIKAAQANSGFLWIKDLTLPDPLFIMPILMVIFQFATTAMTIPRGGGADENQRRINGIMKWTPLIFGFTALQFPAGPVLYWTVSSIFSTIQQYIITGFGSLADLPGLSWLPQKKLPEIKLQERAPVDDGKPRKKTLMERLADQQERLATERAGQGGADAGKPVNNFGRRSDAGPLGTKKPVDKVEDKKPEPEKIDENTDIWADEDPKSAKASADAGDSKSKSLGAPPKPRPKGEQTMRNDYRPASRPPKKIPPSGGNQRRKK